MQQLRQPDRDKPAYLLVGHGTRNASGQRQFQAVYQQFAELMAPRLTGFAYLELAEPGIEEAVARLAELGAGCIQTVPVLLFAAGHALQDIPQAVAAACQSHGLTPVGQTAPLELSPAILELSALRFRQAVCQTAQQPNCLKVSCLNICEGTHCAKTALALIGRGSRSTVAADHMRQFSALRRQITPVSQLVTGFVYAQTPSVPEVLAALAGSHCGTVVVQPHLLFEGELIEQLRQQVAEATLASPTQRWVVTQTLGTDFALAETLSQLASEGLDPIE